MKKENNAKISEKELEKIFGGVVNSIPRMTQEELLHLHEHYDRAEQEARKRGERIYHPAVEGPANPDWVRRQLKSYEQS